MKPFKLIISFTAIIVCLYIGINCASAQSGIKFHEYVAVMDSAFQNDIDLIGIDSMIASECSEYNHYLKWKREMFSKWGPEGREGDIYLSLKSGFENPLPVYDNSGPWREIGPVKTPINSPLDEVGGGEVGIGPLNFISFAPDYSNSSLVFTGGWYSGLWYSENGGLIWKNAGTDQISPKTSAAHCVSSHDNNNIWFMCTGNGDGLFNNGPWQSCRADGVYRTFDRGQTWQKIGDESDFAYSTSFYNHDPHFSPFQIKKLLLDPHNPEILYVTTSFGIYRTESALVENPESVGWELVLGWDQAWNCNNAIAPLNATNSIFSSFDLEYTEINETPTLIATISKLAYNGQITLPTFPSSWNQYVTDPNWVYSTSIVFSSAFGTYEIGDICSWQELQMPVQVSSNQRCSIAISPSEPETMFIWSMKLNGQNFLHRYDWNTNSWDVELVSMSDWALAPHAHVYCADGLAISPQNPNLLYLPCGDSSSPAIAAYTFPASTSQKVQATDRFHVDIEHIAFSPDGSELWLASHGGIYVYRFAENTWEDRNSGLGIAEVDGFSQEIGDSGNLLIGLFHDGSMIGENYDAIDTMNWNQVSGGDGRFTMINQDNTDISYTSNQYLKFKKNSDGWNSSIYTELWKPTLAEPVGALNYFENNRIYIEGRNVHRNDYGGSNSAADWTQLSNFPSDWNIRHISASHVNPALLMVSFSRNGSNGVAICNRANSEAEIAQSNWIVLPGNFGAVAMQSDPINPNRIFVASDYYNEPWLPGVQNKLVMYEFTGNGNGQDLANFDFGNYTGNASNLFTMQDLTKNFPNLSATSMYVHRGTRDIYLGTGLGVYICPADLLLGESPDPWYLYGSNLPHCDAKFLNPTFKENKLRVGTHGRGIWEIGLPCEKIDESLVIPSGSSLIWHRNYSFRQDVEIMPGAEVVIKGDVGFAPDCGIIVHNGGKLTIDGGRISNACGSFWKGIQVVGNPGAGQNSSVQGVVELKNGAIIEHAEIGVLAGMPPQTAGKKSYLKGGGIVKCIGSEFRNNVVDIRFAPYLFAPSASYVFDSQLITDEVYSEERLPESHIIMERIKGVKIRGNWFNNEVYEQYAPKTRGIGISSNTATYEVIPYCTYNINGVCQSSVENRFSNLYQGIQAYSTSLAFPFAVQDAFFENNVGGIAMTGVYGASVTRCEFEVPGDVELPNPDASAFGIYLFGCAGFEIEENNLVRSPNGAQLTSGIAVRESIGSNRIYKNTMDGFTVGTNVMGKNTGVDFSEGLQVLCNNFGQESMLNTFDIALTDFEMDYTDNEPTMAATQGVMPEDDQDFTAPAGNLFSYNPASTAFDYYAEPDANSVIYFSHSPSQNFNVIPQTIEGELSVQTPVTTVNYDPANSCPSEINYQVDVPSLISKMALLDGLLEDEWSVYEERVDMGSTTNLVAFINNPGHSSIEVRNELMLYPKDISDDAWKAAVYRIPAMNPWHLAQALIAGSPLRPEVIHMMEEADIDQYYIDLVKNNQPGGVTQKMILESEIIHFNGKRQSAFADMARAYLEGDSALNVNDVLTHLTRSDLFLRASLQADILMANQSFEDADDVLALCVLEDRTQEWCSLQQELNNVLRDSISWDSLPQQLIDQSLYLSLNPQKLGSAQAQSLLIAATDSLFDQEIAYPQSAKNIGSRLATSGTIAAMAIYPNPASDAIQIVLDNELSQSVDRIELIDTSGKLALAVTQSRNAIWIADVGNLSSGQYVARAFSAGQFIKSAKFQIAR